MKTITLERTREAWARAAAFPADKEGHYPEHTRAQEFDKHAGKRVLEYGCGGGSDAMSYLRRGCAVTYVDVVPGNVEAATTRIGSAGLAEKATGIALDESDRIPVSSCSFDLASAHGVLHHIVDPLPVLRELYRVLRVGGRLYVMLYTEHLRTRLDADVARLMIERGLTEGEAFGWCTDGEGAPYARSYTEDEGKALLRSAGFTPEDDVVEYNARDFRTFQAFAR